MFWVMKSVLVNKNQSNQKKSHKTFLKKNLTKKHLVGMYELSFRNQIILHNKL